MENSATRRDRAPAESPYVLDNAGKEASARFPALSVLFDAGTIRHFEALGVSPGWRCLEIGGGGGSVASWLAARVGPTGHVLVTDIDPRFLESLHLENAEVRRHDISTDPLPDAAFDLVHARLVLVHVLQRERALAQMIAALKPGGWLIDEEFDSSVFPDPALGPGEVLSKTHLAMTRVMDDRGVDRNFGRRLFGLMRTLGLVDVAAEGRTIMFSAGSAGPSLLRSNYEQLHDAMIGAGYITEQDFRADLARLDDPEFMLPSPVLWAVRGRRP
jgi:SAM-dependent methyltransferase